MKEKAPVKYEKSW